MIYSSATRDGEAVVFFDPNMLAEDGTIALRGMSFSAAGVPLDACFVCAAALWHARMQDGRVPVKCVLLYTPPASQCVCDATVSDRRSLTSAFASLTAGGHVIVSLCDQMHRQLLFLHRHG